MRRLASRGDQVCLPRDATKAPREIPVTRPGIPERTTEQHAADEAECTYRDDAELVQQPHGAPRSLPWLVTFSGAANLDLCLLLEPSTSAPYRIEDAITRNRARTLDAGQSHIYEVELESLDKLL